MQPYKKYKKIIGISTVVLVSSGLGWLVLQVHKTRRIINSAVDTSIIEFFEPQHKDDNREDGPFLQKLIRKYKTDIPSPTEKWNSLKFILAQRLITLAKTDVKPLKRRAIIQLSKINNLEAWHYPVLANMCDAKTAVSLSRMKNIDLRLIRGPSYKTARLSHDDAVNTMKELLIRLNASADHLCMAYFLERAFPDSHDDPKYVDHDYPHVDLNRMIETTSNILPLCVESILHHSSVDTQARDIILENGLPLLMEIYKMFPNSMEVHISLCKILSNVSIFPEYLEEIFNTGWIRILAEWTKNVDLRLSLPACKALANLEPEKDADGLYPRSVYVLYPSNNTYEKPYVDVIFVHGLLGGVFFTWRQRLEERETIGLIGKQRDKGKPRKPLINKALNNNKVLFDPVESITVDESTMKCCPPKESQSQMVDGLPWPNDWECEYEYVLYDLPINSNEDGKGPFTFSCNKMRKSMCSCYSQCWPKDWLPEDCSNLRVIGINYDTNLSMWSPLCPREQTKTTIDERSNELMAKLLKAGVGDRPIVWVAHSMGGLLVKNMLCKSWKSRDKATRNLVDQTKSIVFYSTPHTGSRVANVSPPTSYLLWPSVEVQELRQESPALVDLHDQFLNLVIYNPMNIVSFVETKPILVTAMKFNFLLVEPGSGNPGIGEYFEIPQDHLGICKPKNKHSFLYQKVLHIIKEAVKEEKYNYSFVGEKTGQSNFV